jgi:hypothetical protein
MAYGFGTTVNPQLGATNYSGYLQGALSGAQMQAQGGAAIAQGITAGIEKYQQNKMITSTQIGKFEAAAKSDPGIIQQAPEAVKKLLKKLEDNGNLGLNDAARLGAYVDVYNQQEPQRIASQAAIVQNLMAQTGGSVPSVVDMNKFDPRAVSKARSDFLGDQLKASQTAQNLASAQPRQEGTPMSSEQFNALINSGRNVSGTPMPDGKILVRTIGASAPNASFDEQALATELQIIEQKEGRPATPQEKSNAINEILARRQPRIPTREEKFKDLELTDFSKSVSDFKNIRLPSAMATMDNINRIRSLQVAGGTQGPGATIRLEVAKGINAIVGSSIIDTSKEEAMQTTYSDMVVNAAQKMRGQGQITEKERELLLSSIAKFGNSPEAAKYILSFMEAVSAREISLAEMYDSLREKGATVDERINTWNSYIRKNPLSFNGGMVTFGPGVTAPKPINEMTQEEIEAELERLP